MTIEQFGQTIKAKYPEYKDLPDAEIGSKMLTKYPQYNDLVKKESSTQKVDTFLSGHPILKGISDFVGTTGLGKGIAQGIFLKFTPEGKDILDRVSKGQMTTEEVENVIGKTATTKEILGSAAQTALSAATLGGAGSAGSLGARTLKTAALGAGTGAATAFGKSGSIKDITKGAAIGGATGAGLSLAGAGLSKIASSITDTLPKRLVQSAIGQSKAELLAGKDVSEYVLKSKKVGTADKLIKDATTAVERLSKQIQTNLESGAPKTVRILKNEPLKEVVNSINSSGGAVTAKEVSKIVESLAPQAKGLLSKQSLSLTEANRLRQALDKTLGDRAFLTNQLPFNKEVLRGFTNALRDKVKTLAPQGTADLYSELSKEITLRNSLLDKYSGQARNQVLNAFDLIIGAGGFLGGGPVGLASSVALKKTAQSAVGKTLLGQSLYQGGKLATPALKTAAPLAKQTVLRGVSSVLPVSSPPASR